MCDTRRICGRQGRHVFELRHGGRQPRRHGPADGRLHDDAWPTINGMAIEYGLVPPDQAKPVRDRIGKKIVEVNFTRFDLGVVRSCIDR